MTKTQHKILTAVELQTTVAMLLKEHGSFNSKRQLAKLAHTSEKRLDLIYGKGNIPGLGKPREIKTDDQLVEQACSLLKIQPNLTLGQLQATLRTKKERLARVLPPNLLPSMGVVDQLRSANKRQLQRSNHTLKKIKKILNNHGEDKLICQTCEKTNFAPYETEQVLTIDHIFGPNYRNNEHLRVICNNCHVQTLNCRRTGQSSLDKDYVSSPPADFQLKTINLLTKNENSKNYKNYKERLQKQALLTGELQKKEQVFLTNLQPVKLHRSFTEHDNLVRCSTKSSKILDKLISTGFKEAKCEFCNSSSWRGFAIGPFLELHHEDGNTKNQQLKNFKVLCANCHMGVHFDPPKKNVEIKHPVQNNPRNLLRSGLLLYDAEAEAKKRFTINNPQKAWTGWEGSKDARLAFAIVTAPNRPPTMDRCAKTLGINSQRFARIIKTFWPDLWPADASRYESSYWLGDFETRLIAKVIYNVLYNIKSPVYIPHISTTQAVKIFGDPDIISKLYGIRLKKISRKTWDNINKKVLAKNFFILNGNDPFNAENIFTLDKLEIPIELPLPIF